VRARITAAAFRTSDKERSADIKPAADMEPPASACRTQTVRRISARWADTLCRIPMAAAIRSAAVMSGMRRISAAGIPAAVIRAAIPVITIPEPNGFEGGTPLAAAVLPTGSASRA
jgi:hypothetical protein